MPRIDTWHLRPLIPIPEFRTKPAKSRLSSPGHLLRLPPPGKTDEARHVGRSETAGCHDVKIGRCVVMMSSSEASTCLLSNHRLPLLERANISCSDSLIFRCRCCRRRHFGRRALADGSERCGAAPIGDLPRNCTNCFPKTKTTASRNRRSLAKTTGGPF